MDFIRTIYSFDPTISIIMLLGIGIGIWGIAVERNKRIFMCLITAEVMYGVLVYLGMKFEYLGILAFFGLVIVITCIVYLYN